MAIMNVLAKGDEEIPIEWVKDYNKILKMPEGKNHIKEVKDEYFKSATGMS